jgi:hypothetical protein
MILAGLIDVTHWLEDVFDTEANIRVLGQLRQLREHSGR